MTYNKGDRKKLDLILGVDGGATKTTAWISDSRGNFIAGCETGPSNFKSVGIDKTKDNINKAVLGAVNKAEMIDKIFFKSACFGMSGIDSDKDKEIYNKIIFNDRISNYLDPEKTLVCNDSKIGLVAGSNNKNAIMIICGTGANCYGENKLGKVAQAGGWDYILGDQGSGFDIGFKALRAAMKSYDGRGRATLLSRTILEDLNIDNISDLIKWTYDLFSKEKIAQIAKTVCRTAEMGDKISRDILEEEVDEIIISIKTVIDKLDLRNKNFDLVLVGNVLKCKKYFKDILIKKLDEVIDNINYRPLTLDPVEGAIKLALKNLK